MAKNCMNKESPGITSSSRSKEQMMQELENLVAMFIDTGHTCNATGLFDGKMGMVIFLVSIRKPPYWLVVHVCISLSATLKTLGELPERNLARLQ
jgi:hypothetical protein